MSEESEIKVTPVEEPVNSTENDPYAYLNRGEFSSEKFKIEIKNLPKFYGISEFLKFLNDKLKLNVNKLKTPKRNSPYAFACFRNIEDRDNAIKVLTNYKWKGKVLLAIKAKPAPDPLVKKRKDNEELGEESDSKKPKLSQEIRLMNSTTPLWNLPYDKQLEQKQAEAEKILMRLTNHLYHNNNDLREWITKQKANYNGIICEILNIRHAEGSTDGYRNKCEFSVGLDEETGLKTVGFRIGSYVNGITGVGPVDNLKHIPDSMKAVVRIFQEFVRASELQVFNPEIQTGHFRQLAVRSAPDQLMVVVGIHPQNLNENQLNEFKKKLVEYFSNGQGKEAKVTSLYLQFIIKKSSGGELPRIEHLWGETHIYETVLGLKFRISPEAFFQINTKGAEILYKSAIEMAEVDESSTVLDICCGTGTIGLCFSKSCNQVLGLEVIPQAIVDAKENAKINGITNSEFFTGKAEEILGMVCSQSKAEEIIAVADPPRAGLHLKAIPQLRKLKKIQRLVYISCNPNAAFKNFTDLGRPESKTIHGEPFVPVKAVVVDLFPYTKHYELVICFERWDKVKAKCSTS